MRSTTSGRPSASTSATLIQGTPAFSQGNQLGTGVKGVCISNRSLEGGWASHRRTRPGATPPGLRRPAGAAAAADRVGGRGQRVVPELRHPLRDHRPGQHLRRQRCALDRLDQPAEDVGIRARGGGGRPPNAPIQSAARVRRPIASITRCARSSSPASVRTPATCGTPVPPTDRAAARRRGRRGGRSGRAGPAPRPTREYGERDAGVVRTAPASRSEAATAGHARGAYTWTAPSTSRVAIVAADPARSAADG